MDLVPGVEKLQAPSVPTALTIGNFDGVHRGHQELIKAVVEHARNRGLRPAAVVFHPHPTHVLPGARPVTPLFDERDQREQLAHGGIDVLIEQPFTVPFSKVSAEDFFTEYLLRPLRPQVLVIGHDFSCGHGKEGDTEFLRAKGQEAGIEVVVIPPKLHDGLPVSSTRIRQAVQSGNVGLARDLLGRKFYVQGFVRHGEGRGRTIGIPTVNITPPATVIPKKGVYAGYLVEGERRLPAVANIGVNPTFNGADHPLKIEAHILDHSEDWYGREIRLEFAQFLRDEMKFSGVEALIAQIRQDIASARVVLKS